MTRNRALEFLGEAYGLMEYYSNYLTSRALVRFAIGEVQELLDQLALYESQAASSGRGIETSSYGVIVEDERAMIPARLVTAQRPRAALPNTTAINGY